MRSRACHTATLEQNFHGELLPLPLPTSLVPFCSAEGRVLCREALEGGTGYFPLAEQVHIQAEPAYCGLGALVGVSAR